MNKPTMNRLPIGLYQSQLEYIATLFTILAPILAFGIYFHRRYTTRKNIAGALIEEIKQNRRWANGQQPHYEQHGIVGLGETFQYPSEAFSDGDDFWKGKLPTPKVVVPDYEEGDIPSSARATSKVYDSTASEISRFNSELAADLALYYHQLSFMKDLNDTIHEGRDLPPAAYSVLSDGVDRHLIENEELVSELEIEMKRFPQMYRHCVTAKDRIATGMDKSRSKFDQLLHRDSNE